MDKLLQSLLREWDYLLQLQDETLKALPEYPLVYSEYTRLADELEQRWARRETRRFTGAMRAHIPLTSRCASAPPCSAAAAHTVMSV